MHFVLAICSAQFPHCILFNVTKYLRFLKTQIRFFFFTFSWILFLGFK